MLNFYRVVIGPILLAVISVSPASEKSLDQYLKQKIASIKLDSAYLTQNDYFATKPGWIDATEVRLGAENDDDNKHSIALRLNLSNASRIDVEEDILKLQKQAQHLDQQNNLNQELETVYSQMLELISQHESLNHLEKQSSLVETEIKYYRQLAQTSDFNPNDLLESELNLTQLQSLIDLQKREILDFKNAIGFKSDVPQLALTSEQMLALVTRYQQETNIEIEQAQLALQLMQHRLKHEKASEGLALNAVQLESESADGKDDVLSVRFDVQIPFSGPRFNSAQKQQDITQAKYRMQRSLRQSTVKTAQLLQKLKQNNDRIFTFEQLANQLQTRIKNTTNASLILKLKKQHLNQLKKVLQVRQDTRQFYIEFLANSGLLAKKPDSNWLLLQ